MAPRVTRGPRPLPTWGGRRRKGAPRCSSGGSPSRAAAVAAPSSWQPHREPSFQLPVGHASSAVVAEVAIDHSSASSSAVYFSPRDEVSTSSLQPPCISSPSGCSPQQPELATCVADADGAGAIVIASLGNPFAALQSSLLEEKEPLSPVPQMEVALLEEEDPLSVALPPEEEEEGPLSPAVQMELAKLILFHFDLAREKRMLSTDELDFYDDLKSLLPHLEAQIGGVNADGVDVVEEEEEDEEEPLSPAFQKDADGVDEVEIGEVNADLADAVEEEEPLSPADKLEVAIEILFRLDLARKKRMLSTDELDLIIHLKSLLPRLEAEIGEVNEEEEEEEEPLSLEAALKVMFRLDLAREMRILSADELDLYDDMKSLLPRLEAKIGEVNVDGTDAVEKEVEEEPLSPALQKDADGVDDVEGEEGAEEEDEEEPLSPADKLEVAIEILFRLELARKKRMLSAIELDLVRHLKSQLPRLEAEIGEVNKEEEELEEEEEPLSLEAALKVIFRLDLAREMRILSTGELDLYDDMKSLLPRLEAEIGEADGADAVEEEEEDNADGADDVEEEPLSPAVKMEIAIEVLFRLDLARKKRILSTNEVDLINHLKSQLPLLEAEIGEVNEEEEEEEEEEPLSLEAALRVMFRLDLAREMRILSSDELELYDDMKSLLPSLEAEIGEVATAPSIALEDPPTCQLHAPSVALAGAKEVPSPMVPGASTSIKHSADLQLADRNIVVTNAELSTPGPEAMPSALKSSAEPEPAVEDDEITEALYGHSDRRRRLPIFRDICPGMNECHSLIIPNGR